MIPKFLLTACIALAFLSGCKKSDPSPTPVTITGISVTHGPENTLVTITGTGFSATIGNDHVTFNGVEAVLTAATSTQLTTSVPRKAGTGKISVRSTTGQADGPVFTYDYSNATVTTLAGGPTSPDLGTVNGLALDATGNIYVTDATSNRVARITPAGTVNSFSGSGQFTNPVGITLDAAGNVYVVDNGTGGRIWKFNPSGVVSVLAGSTTTGFADGTGAAAKFYNPFGITVDSSGDLYVSDGYNNRIRKITTAGVVTTVAGSGVMGETNGPVLTATLSYPLGIYSNHGALLISEGYGPIRRVVPGGDVSTIAGIVSTSPPYFVDGAADSAKFFSPTGIAMYDNNILVADFFNNRLRLITPSGNVVTLLGGDNRGYDDGDKNSALLNGPVGIVVDTNGNIYIADSNNKAVRKVILE